MLVKGSAATEGLSGSRSGAVCIPIDAPRSIVTRYTRTGRLMFLICCLGHILMRTTALALGTVDYRLGGPVRDAPLWCPAFGNGKACLVVIVRSGDN